MPATYDVLQDISPNDEMFEGHVEHYFGVGRSALACIGMSLAAANVPDVRRILDLPCGHGRVMRHLRARFPDATIYACDLARDGVDYCARTFDAVPVYSCDDPSRIAIPEGTFDLVWVGSLLTHLDAERWPGFLDLFRRALRPGGVAVFTTCGRFVYHRTVQGEANYGLSPEGLAAAQYGYRQIGFGYANYSHSSAYGISITSPAWVVKQITAIDDLKVVHVCERVWDRHQDLFAFVRDPGWQSQ